LKTNSKFTAEDAEVAETRVRAPFERFSQKPNNFSSASSAFALRASADKSAHSAVSF
jgi:hypothetical protein